MFGVAVTFSLSRHILKIILLTLINLWKPPPLRSESWPSQKATWKAALLSIPCSFILMKQSDFWLESYNRRQAILQHHESLSRTAMQLSMELQSMKAVVENMGPSAQKMKDAQLVQELVKLGCKSVVSGRRKDGEDADSGALTVNLLQSAQQVSKHILSNPACVAVLLELENDFGTRSPFHRMGALACAALQCGSGAFTASETLCLSAARSLVTSPRTACKETSAMLAWWHCTN